MDKNQKEKIKKTEKKPQRKKKTKALTILWTIVIISYLITFFLDQGSFMKSINFFTGLIWKILLILMIIFALMAVLDYFVKPKQWVRLLGKEAGLKGWLLAVGGGILSTGPIFLWYPLMQQLQQKEARTKFIAAFLYARAIKPALLPMMIYYFGVVYTIVVTLLVFVGAVLQGILVAKFVDLEPRI